jgi:preprotein translocase subunit SecA
MANPLKMIFGSRNDRVLRRIKKTVKKINALEESLKGLDDDALRAKTQEFRERFQQGEVVGCTAS